MTDKNEEVRTIQSIEEREQNVQDREDDAEDQAHESRKKHHTEVEHNLIDIGLLPYPDQISMDVERSNYIPTSPLIEGYESVMHQMAHRMQHDEIRASEIRKERNKARHKATQLAKALKWLQDNYDLDEIAQRVINYVTQEES